MMDTFIFAHGNRGYVVFIAIKDRLGVPETTNVFSTPDRMTAVEALHGINPLIIIQDINTQFHAAIHNVEVPTVTN